MKTEVKLIFGWKCSDHTPQCGLKSGNKGQFSEDNLENPVNLRVESFISELEK